jgi:hypothetical protein
MGRIRAQRRVVGQDQGDDARSGEARFLSRLARRCGRTKERAAAGPIDSPDGAWTGLNCLPPSQRTTCRFVGKMEKRTGDGAQTPTLGAASETRLRS